MKEGTPVPLLLLVLLVVVPFLLLEVLLLVFVVPVEYSAGAGESFEAEVFALDSAFDDLGFTTRVEESCAASFEEALL